MEHKIRNFLLVVVGLSLSFYSLAQDRYSFGVGLGAQYNGFGGNFGLVDDASFKYGSLGCSNYTHTSNEGSSSKCGVGAGWMRSDLLSSNNKHAIGLHVGLTYDTRIHGDETGVYISVPYVYFFRNIVTGGFNLGVAPVLEVESDGDTDAGVWVSIGYQF